jgi:tRNA nucleotidyltransferase (CCA-adding enzyme)
MMNIYLVGGAVRDQLLGQEPKERDWVVVGATVKEMQALGFRQVGKDFPVFLHPKTHEEYALARVERKVGRGYTGFEFEATPFVTLEEDLKRRDLTINAMAMTQDGTLIDPYHGKKDLENRLLRHVSPAFSEDPVRILRVARFAARFDFKVAEETLLLMQKMVAQKEVDALVAERVWKEWERALSEPYPHRFFEVLTASHAMPVLFPMVIWSKELNMLLMKAAAISKNNKIRFAVVLHALSPETLQSVCERYRVPADFRELALLIVKYSSLYQCAATFSAEEILSLLEKVDAFRREERFYLFLEAASIITGEMPRKRWISCYEAAKKIDIQDIVKEARGKEIAEKIRHRRKEAIEVLMKMLL